MRAKTPSSPTRNRIHMSGLLVRVPPNLLTCSRVHFCGCIQPLEELLDLLGYEGISDLEVVDDRRAIVPAFDRPVFADEAEAFEVAAEGDDVACVRERLRTHLLRGA